MQQELTDGAVMSPHFEGMLSHPVGFFSKWWFITASAEISMMLLFTATEITALAGQAVRTACSHPARIKDPTPGQGRFVADRGPQVKSIVRLQAFPRENRQPDAAPS